MTLLSKQSTIVSPNAATKKMIQQDFAILKQKKQTLTILILLFICMLGWGIVSLFATQRDSKVDSEMLKLAKPLSPSVDTTALAKLESKRDFTTEELANFAIYKIVIDTKSQKERIISIDEVLTESETTK